MKILFQPIHPRFERPVKATPGSAGFDMQFWPIDMKDVVLEPGHRVLLPLGCRMAIQEGYEGQVRPRSGHAFKKGITILNAPGTIDCDYRGEVMALAINHGSEPFTFEPGMKICQLVPSWVPVCETELVDELPATVRGEGGFGSTGQ